jgi:hypothetical protein
MSKKMLVQVLMNVAFIWFGNYYCSAWLHNINNNYSGFKQNQPLFRYNVYEHYFAKWTQKLNAFCALVEL